MLKKEGRNKPLRKKLKIKKNLKIFFQSNKSKRLYLMSFIQNNLKMTNKKRFIAY
jgi:hypothetical protein